jgi:hypothetical protein
MTDNRTLILEEFEKLKGRMVISWGKVYRLIGISEDDIDYYYVLYDGRKIVNSTCVGRITPLKCYILDSHYEEMISLAKGNHYDQPTLFKSKEDISKFNEEHKKEVTEGINFIAGPYWELN